jgi:hypothetical protein
MATGKKYFEQFVGALISSTLFIAGEHLYVITRVIKDPYSQRRYRFVLSCVDCLEDDYRPMTDLILDGLDAGVTFLSPPQAVELWKQHNART